ncbi:MAG: hypothetical protein HWE27_11800 [Gammaproteobacteria bacterium]|nr:hypothetical protein [Gammaproteobacteria bacterium]
MPTKIIIVLLVFAAHLTLEAGEAPKFLDTGINELKLENANSGKSLLSEMPLNCKAVVVDYYCFFNKDETQNIELNWHPGSNRFTISEVTVKYGKGDKSSINYPSNTSEFMTIKGIKLGVSPSYLKNKLGEPTSINANVYYYRAESNQYIFEEYNMPIYYGQYKFENEALIEFRFGFEYP